MVHNGAFSVLPPGDCHAWSARCPAHLSMPRRRCFVRVPHTGASPRDRHAAAIRLCHAASADRGTRSTSKVRGSLLARSRDGGARAAALAAGWIMTLPPADRTEFAAMSAYESKVPRGGAAGAARRFAAPRLPKDGRRKTEDDGSCRRARSPRAPAHAFSGPPLAERSPEQRAAATRAAPPAASRASQRQSNCRQSTQCRAAPCRRSSRPTPHSRTVPPTRCSCSCKAPARRHRPGGTP